MKTNFFKKYGGIAVSLLIALLMTAFLFKESFSGMVLQGVDDNISMRMMMLRSLQSGQGYHFFPVYWLGYVFNLPNPDLYTTVLALTNSIKVVGVYIIALLLSMGLMYAFLRRLNISKEASIFGALSYSFLPHVLSLVYSGHTPAISAIPMTPGFLLALTVLVQEKQKKYKVFAALWAGVFWAQMALGEPQRAVYGTVLGGAWTLYLLIQEEVISLKKPFIPKYFWTALFPYFLIVPAVGFIVFYPTFTFWAGSEFAAQQGSWEFSTSWSFPPSELLDSLAFGYHGLATGNAAAPYWGDKPLSGNSDSLGFFLITFTLIGSFLLWKSQKRGHVRFFIIAGALALLLSFGKYFPGTPFFWLWYHLPGMNKVRVPAKFLSITGLCWAVTAAMGLQAIKDLFESVKKDDDKQKAYIIYGTGGVLLLLALWLGMLFITSGGDATSIRAVLGRDRNIVDMALTSRLNAVLSMFTLFLCVFILFFAANRSQKFVKLLPLGIIILSAYNLYVSNRFYITQAYVDEAEFYPETPYINYLLSTQDPRFRISGSLFIPNVQKNTEWPIGSVTENQLYGANNYDLTYAFPYFDINAFGRIPISRLDAPYKTFFQAAADSVPSYTQNSDIWEMNKRLWFMGNVDRIVLDSNMEQAFASSLKQDAELLTNVQGTGGTWAVYKLKLNFPRFALLNGVKPTTELLPLEEMIKNLNNLGLYQPIVKDNGALLTNNDTTVYSPLVERISFNSYSISLSNITNDQMFVFGDLYDQGWKASIDGMPVEILRANAVQQAFLVPAGSQEILIQYNKPVKGLLLSRLIILICILLSLAFFCYNLMQKPKNSLE